MSNPKNTNEIAKGESLSLRENLLTDVIINRDPYHMKKNEITYMAILSSIYIL